MKKRPRSVEVYVDGTDWRYEIGEAADGNKVYPSVECAKEESKCWEECGIVKCQLVFKQWVVEEKAIKDWKSDTSMVIYDPLVERLRAAERHLAYLEEKFEKQKNKVILLKTEAKGRK